MSNSVLQSQHRILIYVNKRLFVLLLLKSRQRCLDKEKSVTMTTMASATTTKMMTMTTWTMSTTTTTTTTTTTITTTISCDWFVQLLTKPTIQRYLLNNLPQIVDQKNRPEQSESNICPENEMG